MMLAALTLDNAAWLPAAALAAAVLVPLAWLALRPAGPQAGARAFGLGLRVLGIALLLLCLLDPQWVSSRPKKGANLVAILADNSRSLQVADANETSARGDKLRTALAASPAPPWLEKLSGDFELRPYLFDRELRRVRDFGELDFQGNGTALGSALKKLRERLAGQPLAGIILFTDGNATDLPNGLGDTSGLPPIYPVLLGTADGLRDAGIARVEVRQTSFDDAPVTLRTELNAQGLAGNDYLVSLRPLVAAADGELPAPQSVTLAADGEAAAAAEFSWRPGGTGIQFFEVSASTKGTATEATLLNNRRAVLVDRGRPAYRILYVSGRPNWEFKFLNRALADDPQLQLPAIIRVANREPKMTFLGRDGETSNPIFRGAGGATDDTQRYDQPVLEAVNPKDDEEGAKLKAGFPKSAAELFTYDAVILDDLEAAFFTPDQLGLLRRFAAERGGGLLMLGGPGSLEDGGYDNTPLAAALPVYLDRRPAPLAEAGEGALSWKLTREGWIEPWTRVRANENDERKRLEAMPQLDWMLNVVPRIKPAATVLATVTDQAGKNYPALVQQNYGLGRVAVIATGGLWQWGMAGGEAGMADLQRFWRQIARRLVTDVPAPVELRCEPAAEEAGAMTLRVTARDKEFRPLDLAGVKITVKRVGIEPSKPGADAAGAAPQFTEVTLPAEPVADAPGQFTASFTPRDAGAYLAEVAVTDRAGQPVGKAQAGWVSDPAADEFRTLAPNRELLAELARRTGGEIISWSNLDALAKTLAQSPAPVTEEWREPLWQQGWVFLAVLACFLAEWGWRRWKGLP